MSHRFKMHLERGKMQVCFIISFSLRLYRAITNVMGVISWLDIHMSTKDENIYSPPSVDNSLYP